MKMLQINEMDAQKILDYLAKRPYYEVFQLVEIMRNIPEVKNVEETKETSKE